MCVVCVRVRACVRAHAQARGPLSTHPLQHGRIEGSLARNSGFSPGATSSFVKWFVIWDVRCSWAHCQAVRWKHHPSGPVSAWGRLTPVSQQIPVRRPPPPSVRPYVRTPSLHTRAHAYTSDFSSFSQGALGNVILLPKENVSWQERNYTKRKSWHVFLSRATWPESHFLTQHLLVSEHRAKLQQVKQHGAWVTRHADRWDPTGSRESARVDGQLLFSKGARRVRWGRVVSSVNSRKLDSPVQRKETGPCLTPCMKTNPKLVRI